MVVIRLYFVKVIGLLISEELVSMVVCLIQASYQRILPISEELVSMVGYVETARAAGLVGFQKN